MIAAEAAIDKERQVKILQRGKTSFDAAIRPYPDEPMTIAHLPYYQKDKNELIRE